MRIGISISIVLTNLLSGLGRGLSTYITDINSATNSVPEDAQIGDSVGIQTYLFDTSLNPVTYSITTQSTTGAFQINATTGVVTVATEDLLDFETRPTETVTVRATDDVTDEYVELEFTIAVTDVDEPVEVINHILIYGQSLSLGSDPDGASVISSEDSGNYMFNGGVRAHYDTPSIANVNSPIDPARMTSLVALAEQLNPDEAQFGETVATGIAQQVSGENLFSATGRGAYPVASLSRNPGTSVDFNHFMNTYAAAMSGSLRVAEAGKTYQARDMVWLQGEADGGSSTSKADWKTRVYQLLADFRTHLTHATLTDTSALRLWTTQMGYGQTGTTYSDIAVAAIEMHRDGLGVLCVGPTYTEEFTDAGDVHMTSAGYRNLGERIGKALQAGATWEPCHITAASRSGTTVSVTVHVPVPPLAFDTTIVTDPGDYGFTYSGAAITAVAITDDGTSDNTATIEITLDADAGGTLGYAYANNALSSRAGPTAGPRGCVRDSDTAVTVYDDTPLYNWLCVDQWSVT